MPRKNLRSHLVGGSVAIAALLIGSGAAWAQSGAAGSSTGGDAAAATASGESADGAVAGTSATGTSDATLSTLPFGLSPQSIAAQRAANRRQAESSEDAALDGAVRNDGGMRFAPVFSPNANTNVNTNAGDFPARAAASSRSPAQGSVSGTGDGRALGLNANLSESVAQGGASGIENSNGRAFGANVTFFAAQVRSKGTTEVQEVENVNGKKLGHAKNLERFDESSIVRVQSANPVVSDAVTAQARPGIATIITAGLPAATVIPSVAAATADDLSSSAPGLQAAPVPEPANWLLLALGLAVLAGRALMRRGTLLR